MKLFIDSATNYLYLAVIKEDEAYAFTRFGKNDHSETLTNYLDVFLKLHNLKVEDVKEVYVGRGPGSYTGLRIAGTVGKVFAFIKKLPLYSFSSLDLIASVYFDKPGKYKALIKAKKNYSYMKAYTINELVNVDYTDMFLSDLLLKDYEEYQDIIVDENTFDNASQMALNIIKYKMYKEEDIYEYVPNYLRSELS